MAAPNSDWRQFCNQASALMRNALHEKEGLAGRRPLHRRTSFERVVDFFENDATISDAKLRDGIGNLLMEVGGSGSKYYIELLGLFEANASEEALVRYFER